MIRYPSFMALAPIVIVLGAALPAMAQEKPVTFNAGIGVIFPQGDVSDRFDTGISFPIGVTFNITESVGIQGEYSYSWMDGPEGTVMPIGGSPTVLETNHTMHIGNANLVFRAPSSGAIGGYVLGGIGVYNRRVELTTPATGLVTVCDPYWFICYPVAVPVDQIIGTRSTTDFGINFGGAITFANRFYVEARYHYAWGPEFDRPEELGGGQVKANGYYIPINFGVRF